MFVCSKGGAKDRCAIKMAVGSDEDELSKT